jgi:hypothetical protein
MAPPPHMSIEADSLNVRGVPWSRALLTVSKAEAQ